MYLKSIELVGFKSFAQRTKLEFEPGMTAIVGPNGCGKSNISDAVRWVLGEQSPKALRGSKMEDCIFNGTDAMKPLSMAEVNLTLADCETALGTEYDEVTITRRVLRSGEGQYYMNKRPCRLKDIQRLFMDTGVGTNSYSLMEQGRIDLILSSRPEDRRAVFEEASGITKYKADKKEAIRKLEHTEANLLRLADVIREVKRQIVSLQRQAGKARRYRQLKEQLQELEIYITRERVADLDKRINTLDAGSASVREQDEALRVDLQSMEEQAAAIRSELASTERGIAAAIDAAAQARAGLDRAVQSIEMNEDRISEFKELSERDTKDAEESKKRLEQHRGEIGRIEVQLQEAIVARDAVEKDFNESLAQLTAFDAALESKRQHLHNIQNEQVTLESRSAGLQNEISDLEARERTTVIRRERLSAEQAEMERGVEVFGRRKTDMEHKMVGLRDAVNQAQTRLSELESAGADRARRAKELETELGHLRSKAAAKGAQIEILSTGEKKTEGFPAGARSLLSSAEDDLIDRSAVLGPLAEKIQAEDGYSVAVEAVLRSSLDALVVRDDDAARYLLDVLRERRGGAVRFVSLAGGAHAETEGYPGRPLADVVKCDDSVRPLIAKLLAGVRVVDSLDEIPSPLPQSLVFATKDGIVIRPDGTSEFWMPDKGQESPLAREQMIRDWRTELNRLQETITGHEQTIASLLSDGHSQEASLAAAKEQLEESKHTLALHEGEFRLVCKEADQANERAETVRFELQALIEQDGSGSQRRDQLAQELSDIRTRQEHIRSEIAVKTDEIRALDVKRGELTGEVTERRVSHAEKRQQVEHLNSRREPIEAQLSELASLIRDRDQGIQSYRQRIENLMKLTDEARERIEPLKAEVERQNHDLEAARSNRQAKSTTLDQLNTQLFSKRELVEEVRARRSRLDVELAEQRMRRQNIVERVTAEYRISEEQMFAHPEPEWEDEEKPDHDTIETTVAELHAKLESMGAVNLVAIDEHKELEERYEFLMQQQDDLVKAKQQLMELIRKINKTTTEMFSDTFNKVNENFQMMFKQLFGGGSAKLVLIDEEDVLDSGIEIIARPPGKKLQTVSLLSGGERTMTAVALLFSLYMVKPSPFCVLDELDAALDDSNIGRFVKMVQGFLDNSQFVVITHNRQTIEAAQVLYGVTMERQGVSKIISVKLSDHAEGEAPSEQPVTSET
ncbi:MAG: chromosome segregation protein SMC [Verrucomicrobia bacterium]|nr:chromosome segregation protein SMC [Verrucomicrobiota bacterium]